jgi:transposase
MLSKVTKKKLNRRIARAPRDKLTQQQREELVSRYANNERVGDLASEYGVSQFTVYRWIRMFAMGEQ